MIKSVKLILSISFFLCLATMPYGYYQLVRFMALIGFGILAYSAYQEKKQTEAVICVCLSILFQPFIKIVLGRDIWNIVDVVVGIGLLISLFARREATKSTK